MSIVHNSHHSGVKAYQKNAKDAKVDESKSKSAEEGKVKAKEADKPKEDTFVKSNEYKTDVEKVNAMKANLSQNISAFKQMVQALLGNQSVASWESIGDLIKIDEATQLAAQEAISENGYWGVNQTAERLLDFAKALTGGDPSKIELMRNAFIEGFKAAEKVWGGKLPDISYQTYEKVMEGFKEWEMSAKMQDQTQSQILEQAKANGNGN